MDKRGPAVAPVHGLSTGHCCLALLQGIVAILLYCYIGVLLYCYIVTIIDARRTWVIESLPDCQLLLLALAVVVIHTKTDVVVAVAASGSWRRCYCYGCCCCCFSSAGWKLPHLTVNVTPQPFCATLLSAWPLERLRWDWCWLGLVVVWLLVLLLVVVPTRQGVHT